MSSPGAVLERLIREGREPDEAASAVLLGVLGDEVLADLDGPAREWLSGLVRREARHIDGRLANRRMKRVLGDGGIPAGTSRFEELAQALGKQVYRLADGRRVLWDDMGPGDVEEKLSVLRKQYGALADHIAILEAAGSLLAERRAARLRDIPGWPEMVRKMTEGRAA